MMDDGKTMSQRRQQWGSQHQLQKLHEIRSNIHDRRNRIPFRLAFARDGMKYICSHPRNTFVSCLVIGFMVLNLNQGPVLNGYLSSQKILPSHTALRTLARGDKDCRKTPFVTPHEAAYSMPSNPAWYHRQLPTHIELCDELIKRNDYITNLQNEEEEGRPQVSPFTKYTVYESHQVCTDWSKPHSALMQIISSTIIASVGERFGLEYIHNCHKILHSENLQRVPFDVATVQMIFPELKMPMNQQILNIGEVVHNLCHVCIEEFNTDNVAWGSIDKTHHCLAFPDVGEVFMGAVQQQVMGRNNMPQMIEKEEVVDTYGNVFHTALESVLPLVRNRLWHQARDWQLESKIPAYDPTTGVVIFIDAGSSMTIPFHLYKEHIPQRATRVDILSGPNCANGKLAVSMEKLEPQSCLEYASELRDYLHDLFKDLAVDVRFELISSTAASYTRMIQTSTLICPPETLSCLLPALAKEVIKNAVIFEYPDSTTYNWFTYLTKAIINIQVIRLTAEGMLIDREQQLIEAKYSGFSVEQVVGPGPELNPVADLVAEVHTQEKTEERTATSELFETDVRQYLSNKGTDMQHYDTSNMRIGQIDEEPIQTSKDEYELVDSERMSSNEVKGLPNKESALISEVEYNLIEQEVPSASIDSVIGRTGKEKSSETDVSYDSTAVFKETAANNPENDIPKETNHLFNTPEESTAVYRSYNSANKNSKEELFETDVDIDYNTLFENWR